MDFRLKMGLFLAGWCALSSVTYACDLANCTYERTLPSGWTTIQSVKTASFQRGSFTGSYVAWTPQMRWQAAQGWALGAFVTALSMTSTAQSAQGLGNVVLFAEMPLWLSDTLMVGTQIQLPSAQTNTGLSSGHIEIMPYTQWGSPMGFGFVFAKGGARFVLGDTGTTGHGIFEIASHGPHLRPANNDVHEVEVFPHTDREFVGQVGWGWQLDLLTVTPYVSGYYSLVTASEQGLSAGSRVDWALSPQWRVSVTGEWPVTTARRENNNIGVWITTLL
ncbi:MAG: hypothetical protein AAB066_06085 [Candidatus Margulisiibacteriota bacterium]